MLSAYDLVDELPPGDARAAAWNYVCQTYADKLDAACPRPSDETRRVVRALYSLADVWLKSAASDAPSSGERLLPAWGTAVRSHDQLVGMRETFDALRTYVAYALPPELEPRLAAVDARKSQADALWIERAPPELRGGIGNALIAAVRETISLGRDLARGT